MDGQTNLIKGVNEDRWEDAITNAETILRTKLLMVAKSHLVEILPKYIRREEIGGLIYAIKFLHAMQRNGFHARREGLLDTGNLCLLIFGLFPGMALQRKVSPDYYAQMGEACFLMLAENDTESASYQIATSFRNMGKVLRTFCFTGKFSELESRGFFSGSTY